MVFQPEKKKKAAKYYDVANNDLSRLRIHRETTAGGSSVTHAGAWPRPISPPDGPYVLVPVHHTAWTTWTRAWSGGTPVKQLPRRRDPYRIMVWAWRAHLLQWPSFGRAMAGDQEEHQEEEQKGRCRRTDQVGPISRHFLHLVGKPIWCDFIYTYTQNHSLEIGTFFRLIFREYIYIYAVYEPKKEVKVNENFKVNFTVLSDI